MKNIVKLFFKYIYIFIMMGSVYVTVEIMWRGYSFASMFILAGICGVLIGCINDAISWEMPIWLQALIGMCIGLSGEFITGYILNVRMCLNLWDYSDMPLNLMGQICVPFALAWYLLSFVAIILDDYIRYSVFGEEKPVYYLWFKSKDGVCENE